MSPEISIIIPVYNVEKYIHECIHSILNQPNVNFEIIAVDDGSPDSCGTILDDYAGKDSRIRVIHQKNMGVSMTRNNGIKEAVGKWSYFVDSDDWLVKGQLEPLVSYANATEADVVFVDGVERYENGKSKRLHLFSKEFCTEEKGLIQSIQNSILCHKYNPYYIQGADNAYPAPWSKLFRTELIKENGLLYDPYVGGVYDDGLFTLEVLQRAKKIAYTDLCAYNYRILSSSIVHAYRKGMVEKFEKNCERIDDFIEKYNKDDTFRNAEYCRRVAYLSSFLSAYFFSEHNPLTEKEKKQELRATINRDPWKTAIRQADTSYLERKHQYTAFCMRKELFSGLKFYAKIKEMKQKSSER